MIILYSSNMVKYNYFKGTQKRLIAPLVSKKEFIAFVGNQFRQLSRRNLGLPMKLYHL